MKVEEAGLRGTCLKSHLRGVGGRAAWMGDQHSGW